jgi:hypothetical protein
VPASNHDSSDGIYYWLIKLNHTNRQIDNTIIPDAETTTKLSNHRLATSFLFDIATTTVTYRQTVS